MIRPPLVRLADLIAYLAVAFFLLWYATNIVLVVATWPDPGRWIAFFVVFTMSIACAIMIGPISRALVDLGRMPSDRS
ncbi:MULTISPECIES: hypothetical protein [unclassified Caballeronia]|uniref:hypothetical protein n=1 Tax=unclassified Caballeronia TaxID=2646786 RepID=UPI002027AFBA|nr:MULTISPECIES: hypothetical protein [unclassified Caballeronia]